MPTTEQGEEKPRPSAAEFVRARQYEILDDWYERVCEALPERRELGRPALLDHVPDILEEIARRLDEIGWRTRVDVLRQLTERHAEERYEAGFDLDEVVYEYAILRECVMRHWYQHAKRDDVVEGAFLLNAAIDRAVATSVTSYTGVRSRLAFALDRISAAGLESDSPEAMQGQMLAALTECVPKVDAAMLALRDGDLLTGRAAMGFGDAVARGFTARAGEGFWGGAMAEGRPRLLTGAALEDALTAQRIDGGGLRVLYALPFVAAGEIVGVAYLGAKRASTFTPFERTMFDAMASRATVALAQLNSRKALEKRARQQAVVAALSVRALSAQTLQRVLDDAVAVVSETLSTDCTGAFELIADDVRMLLRAGAGFEPGLVGKETVGVDAESQYGYTLLSSEPVRVDDFRVESRFSPGPFLRDQGVVSGVSVSIPGLAEHPFGILGTHSKGRRHFTSEDVAFVQAVANVIAAAVQRYASDDELRNVMAQRDAERQRLLGVLEQLPSAVVIAEAPSGRLVLGNEQVSRIWRHDFLRSESAAQYSEWVGFHLDTGARLDASEWGLARALQGETVLDQKVEILRGDGTRAIIHNRCAPIRDAAGRITGAVSVFDDVTATEERHRERTALLESVRRSEYVQRILAEASTRLAESIEYEPTLAKITSLLVPELADWCAVDILEDGSVRRTSVAHVDPDKVALAEEMLRRFPPSRKSAHGLHAVLRTGRSLLMETVEDEFLQEIAQSEEHLRLLRGLELRSYLCVAMVSRGQVLGALTLATTSNRRYTEADVAVVEEIARRAAVAVDNARLYGAAQEAARSRENVLAIVSHDLRNPLGVIALSVGMLIEQARVHGWDGEMTKYIESIQRSERRMERLIGDLLDISSIQANKLSVRLRAVDLRVALGEVVDANGPEAAEQEVAIVSEAPPSPVWVRCDRERLVQALSNLVGNAIKYAGDGGRITLRAEPRSSEVIIEVIDMGPGIPKEELVHVFEAYWTAPRAGKTGTGLGLYITKGIIEAHGGRIWVESQVGIGTTFGVALPLAPGPDGRKGSRG